MNWPKTSTIAAAAAIAVLAVAEHLPDRKRDADDPIVVYCSALEGVARVATEARDRNVPEAESLAFAQDLAIAKSNASWAKDAVEVVEFVYRTATDQSADTIGSFVYNQWCMPNVGRLAE